MTEEVVYVSGMERSDIHKIAKRVGIRIKCQKDGLGFWVRKKVENDEGRS